MVVLGVLRLEAAMAEWMGGVRCGGGMLPDGTCLQGQGQHLVTMAEWMGFASTNGKSWEVQANTSVPTRTHPAASMPGVWDLFREWCADACARALANLALRPEQDIVRTGLPAAVWKRPAAMWAFPERPETGDCGGVRLFGFGKRPKRCKSLGLQRLHNTQKTRALHPVN